MDLEKLREITEKLQRSMLLKGIAYQVLDTFIKQQELAINYSQCCKSDSEQLFCENVIHQNCKWFDQYNGCMGCLVKKYEAK